MDEMGNGGTVSLFVNDEKADWGDFEAQTAELMEKGSTFVVTCFDKKRIFLVQEDANQYTATYCNKSENREPATLPPPKGLGFSFDLSTPKRIRDFFFDCDGPFRLCEKDPDGFEFAIRSNPTLHIIENFKDFVMLAQQASGVFFKKHSPPSSSWWLNMPGEGAGFFRNVIKQFPSSEEWQTLFDTIQGNSPKDSFTVRRIILPLLGKSLRISPRFYSLEGHNKCLIAKLFMFVAGQRRDAHYPGVEAIEKISWNLEGGDIAGEDTLIAEMTGVQFDKIFGGIVSKNSYFRQSCFFRDFFAQTSGEGEYPGLKEAVKEFLSTGKPDSYYAGFLLLPNLYDVENFKETKETEWYLPKRIQIDFDGKRYTVEFNEELIPTNYAGVLTNCCMHSLHGMSGACYIDLALSPHGRMATIKKARQIVGNFLIVKGEVKGFEALCTGEIVCNREIYPYNDGDFLPAHERALRKILEAIQAATPLPIYIGHKNMPRTVRPDTQPIHKPSLKLSEEAAPYKPAFEKVFVQEEMTLYPLQEGATIV